MHTANRLQAKVTSAPRTPDPAGGRAEPPLLRGAHPSWSAPRRGLRAGGCEPGALRHRSRVPPGEPPGSRPTTGSHGGIASRVPARPRGASQITGGFWRGAERFLPTPRTPAGPAGGPPPRSGGERRPPGGSVTPAANSRTWQRQQLGEGGAGGRAALPTSSR